MEAMNSFKRGLSYDAEAVYFDGEPIYFWSGEFPYYRINCEEWEDRLDKVKASGVKFITAYIPWNIHEHEEGRFDFSGMFMDGRNNLELFIKMLKDRGLYFIPKPGPFICAEVQHGAIPDWLTDSHPEIILKNSKGENVGFRQDQKPLPDFMHDVYLSYVEKWYNTLCKEVLLKNQYPEGPVVAIQVENEFPYSTSELADPLSWGYNDSMKKMYRTWLKSKYKNIERYNFKHNTSLDKFSDVKPSIAPDKPLIGKEQWLSYQDWVMFKDDYGMETLKRYSEMLINSGMTVSLYHNAGMLEDESPLNLGKLSDILWMGVNFWLGPHPMKSIDSYTHGIRRLKQLSGGQFNAPNIAPELNWGWGNSKEFDFLTRYTMPFLKGINIYTIVDGNNAGMLNGKPYSNNPEPFPGSAPIDAYGNLTTAYESLVKLTSFTTLEGSSLIKTKPLSDVALGFYVPYNFGYIYCRWGKTDRNYIRGDFKNIVGANEFLQAFMKSFIQKDMEYSAVDIQRASVEILLKNKLLIVLCQEIMDESTQNKLAEYVVKGGKLVILPSLPNIDLEMEPADILKRRLFDDINEYKSVSYMDKQKVEFLERDYGAGKVIYLESYLTDGDFFCWLVEREGLISRYAYSDDSLVEVVPVVNFDTKDIYLYITNRSEVDKNVYIYYLDVFNNNMLVDFKTDIQGHSCSIVKLNNGCIINSI